MSWRAALSRSVHELRVVYDAASPASAGTREWVRAHYRELKLLNPGMPVAVRPADGVSPYIAARFDNGVYRSRSTAGMDTISVMAAVKDLAASAPAVKAAMPPAFAGNVTPRAIAPSF
ncbi:hypothetical protein BU14_0416s0013 [Porphyra umbilicalis]|uniref:Ribosomal protein/NADH dehydrogenase domain-containing protein n=1 Tax=Porphyra umbilicalis TaxID=2786 RepID=A0A1X6NVK8_PORUM|nr:hypothetical protein BU14_0416s0013 [Porphyra umbilicalis]|eukprot:OSX72651.1 hypothetical protein BU14_0416s0013 [Porphyra umbilicalis]